MFPAGDWLGIDVGTAAPIVRALPVPVAATYADNDAALATGVLTTESRLYASGTCSATRSGDAFTVTLGMTHLYGVTLLDSLRVSLRCSLILQIFDDDGETVLWEVGTDPAHPAPYLCDPEGYQEQQLDVAAGAATLTTAAVTIVDRTAVAGDQDAGYVMAKLARFGLANLTGHRCLLTRFIDGDLGYQVIADGPAGEVRLDPSYAAFSFEIRDTRETERKIRCFDLTPPRSLVPDELLEGYGYDAHENTWIMEPARPLKGRVERASGYPTPPVVRILVGASEFPEQIRRLLIWTSALDALKAGVTGALDLGVPKPDPRRPENVDFLVRWRLAGSSDPWKEIRETLGLTISYAQSVVTPGALVVGQVIVGDARLDAELPEYDPLAPDLPAEDDIVEFQVIGPVGTDEQHAVVLETPDVGSGTGMINAPGDPALGRFTLVSSIGGFSSGTIDLTATPGNPVSSRRLALPYFETLEDASVTPDVFIPAHGTFRWRLAGSGDPWTEITIDAAGPFGAGIQEFMDTPFDETWRVFLSLILTARDADVPADGADIEFMAFRPAGAAAPLGLTAGQFARNVYDGLYSPRDPVTGAAVPTGIRYDPDAMALMTDLVRIRLTAPIEDARDWLEKMIYGPTGWTPALDAQGRISPVFQGSPTSIAGLATVNNAAAEPSPDWGSGQRLINIVRFKYARDYAAGRPDPNAGEWDATRAYIHAGAADIVTEDGVSYLCLIANMNKRPSTNPTYWAVTIERQHLVGSRDVTVEYREEAAIARYGEQVLELDGSAFRALGMPQRTVQVDPGPGQALPLRARPHPPVPHSAQTETVAGGETLDLEEEKGWQLSEDRQSMLFPRYAFGAPAIGVNVRRAALPNARVGDWVVLDLSWLPDYVTHRRGLLALAQIIALGELDCAWRKLLVELAPLAEGVSS